MILAYVGVPILLIFQPNESSLTHNKIRSLQDNPAFTWCEKLNVSCQFRCRF